MLQQQDGAGSLQPSSDRTMGEIRPKTGNGGTAVSSKGAPAASDQNSVQRCPRCDSLNTKFCYYNNYSLSQPRHFCKNCRRYWTKGGALRSVPVGGGCRKNKRLKHRDAIPIAEMQNVPSSTSLLSSITGCSGPLPLRVGFGLSTSSVVSELARDQGHGYGIAFSGIHESFVHESLNSPRGSIPTSTQDFLAVGSPPSLLSTTPSNDPSFRALMYSKSDPPPAMFHHPQEIPTAFFEHHNTGHCLLPTLDYHDLSSFASSGTSLLPSDTMENSDDQLSLNMPLPAQSYDERGKQLNGGQQGIMLEQEKEDMIVWRSKGKSSAACWQNGTADQDFFVPPSAGPPAIESSLWNVSWPEMHAALGGSSSCTATGAMLH